MGLFKKLKKVIKKVDPIGSKLIAKTDPIAGKLLKDKKAPASAGSTTAARPAGGSGPRTNVTGPAQRVTGVGADAMSTARGIRAGAKSGVGRLNKAKMVPR